MAKCPCGSDLEFSACCEPIISGQTPAPTAEALMRSRYSAHVLGSYEYLGSSVHPDMRGDLSEEEIKEWSEKITWTGLDILGTKDGGENDVTGEVEFVANYKLGGVPQEMHEHAFFRKEGKDWFYVEGMVQNHDTYRRETPKVGRNEPCPCGSGKKFKKCCGKN
ncbi:YchJ family protein [Halodesulfovibrio aestuarii]|uniref:SEC-C motif-containing protein n=1 Tax=Halodesulfovibrio aestuarii TaxID=126333 RepID=A0A8G2CAY2_9BACT|nr:YchJ family protein [Halodesulfovibrio aestuarii]SHJ41810.1 SEC-C motif-containing protein [Halodesulfovibrio aestuarii]